MYYVTQTTRTAQKQWRPETYRCRCTYRRLVAKVYLRPYISRLCELLQPYQLGVGTPQGCEAAVHATRSFIAQTQGEKVLLKLDVKNVFNSIRRDTVLQAAQLNTPSRNLPFHLGLLFFKNISISWRCLS